MAKTYLVNGKVYIGRQFEDKTLVLENGNLTVLEAGCATADGEVFGGLTYNPYAGGLGEWMIPTDVTVSGNSIFFNAVQP